MGFFARHRRSHLIEVIGALMTKRRKKIKYPSEISKPVVLIRQHGFAVPDPNTASGREAILQANREMFELHAKAVEEKLRLLLSYYHVEKKDDWFSLAVRLASDHVPGFERAINQLNELYVGKEPAVAFSGLMPIRGKLSGRPRTWPIDRLLSLARAVEQIKQADKLSKDRDALRRLARRRDWRPPANHRGDSDSWVETLESRLQDAKSFLRREDNILNIMKKLISDSSCQNSGN